AHSELHQAAPRSRHGGWPDLGLGGPRNGARAGDPGLRRGARAAGGGVPMTTATTTGIREGYEEKYSFHDDEQHVFKSRRGLDRAIVEEISAMKGEPQWMRDYRVKALEIFEKKPMPTW